MKCYAVTVLVPVYKSYIYYLEAENEEAAVAEARERYSSGEEPDDEGAEDESDISDIIAEEDPQENALIPK